MRVIVKNDGAVGKVVIGQYDGIEGKELFYPVSHERYNEDQLDLLEDIKYREGTEKEYLEHFRQSFTWGKIIKIHSIAEYQIIECIDSYGETSFHSYINYESVVGLYKTLDKAITAAIINKHTGENSQVNYYLWKMIE